MKLSVLILMTFIVASCGDNDPKIGDFVEANVFDVADAAFNSVGAGLASSKLGLVGCDSTGEPNTEVPGDADYAGEKVFCQLTVNSKSPDTIQGSYFLGAGVMCAIEKVYSFQYLSSATNGDGITFAENDSCFGSGGFDANDDSDTNDMILLSLQEVALSGEDYDFKVSIQLGAATYGSGSDNVIFYLKDSDGKLAAKIVQPGASVTEVVVDILGGEVLFNNRDYSNSRHIRAKVEGGITSAGSFGGVTSAKLIHAESNTTVQFGFDGSKEWYDHYIAGSQDSDYDQCSASPCTSLMTAFNAAFYSFPGTANDYDTADILDLSTFDMSF